MTSNEIRQKFLEFFASKGHKIVPSAPIVIKDDPTLMFTNAGMNQFKDFFHVLNISKIVLKRKLNSLMFLEKQKYSNKHTKNIGCNIPDIKTSVLYPTASLHQLDKNSLCDTKCSCCQNSSRRFNGKNSKYQKKQYEI